MKRLYLPDYCTGVAAAGHNRPPRSVIAAAILFPAVLDGFVDARHATQAAAVRRVTGEDLAPGASAYDRAVQVQARRRAMRVAPGDAGGAR